MRESNRKTFILVWMIAAIVLPGIGCRKSDSGSEPVAAKEAAQSKPSPLASPLTQFEKDLQSVRNGGFTYIWLVARKDGKPLNKEDGDYLRKYAPQVVDWVRADDDGKKFFGGTNFDLEKGNLELLKKRFVVEDYSAK
jgi:hypothetical protein